MAACDIATPTASRAWRRRGRPTWKRRASGLNARRKMLFGLPTELTLAGRMAQIERAYLTRISGR